MATIEDRLSWFAALVGLAYKIGEPLVAIIKAYAKRDLTDEEYAQLQIRWDELEARTRHNAGLDTPST